MPEINPLTNNQTFLKKIAENTGSNYETGDVSEINPLTIDQIFLKEIAANTAGQSGDITELEGKVADNTDAIEAITDVYGAKNVLPFTLATLKALNTVGTWNGNVYTLSGVSFSVVTGTKGEVLSIELSGTASADITFSIADNYSLSNGTFIMNGITTNGLAKIGNSINGTAYDYYTKDDTDGKEYTFSSGDAIYTRIIIDNGTAFANTEIVKPMIRDARITDPTYVPYAMTNRELTDAVTWKYLMTINDNDAHSIGITFKELYAVGNFGSISTLLLSNESAARSGFYRTSDNNGDIYIVYTNGELTVNAYFINGENKVSSGVKIYYR